MSELTNRFREMHESGCFVIPNPWDAGSARLLGQMGFQALATTSSGFAWSLGRPDNHVSFEEALAHLRAISSAVGVPVNGDFVEAAREIADQGTFTALGRAVPFADINGAMS